MARVQHEQAHPAEDRVLHAVDDRVVDLVVGDVAPPEQHVGGVDDLLRQAVLRLLERRRGHLRVPAEQLAQAGGDRLVHAVRVDLPHLRVAALVDVLAPHRDAHHGFPSVVAANPSRLSE